MMTFQLELPELWSQLKLVEAMRLHRLAQSSRVTRLPEEARKLGAVSTPAGCCSSCAARYLLIIRLTTCQSSSIKKSKEAPFSRRAAPSPTPGAPPWPPAMAGGGQGLGHGYLAHFIASYAEVVEAAEPDPWQLTGLPSLARWPMGCLTFSCDLA